MSPDNLANSPICVTACLTYSSQLNDSTRYIKCFGEPAKSCFEDTSAESQKKHIAFDMDY